MPLRISATTSFTGILRCEVPMKSVAGGEGIEGFGEDLGGAGSEPAVAREEVGRDGDVRRGFLRLGHPESVAASKPNGRQSPEFCGAISVPFRP